MGKSKGAKISRLLIRIILIVWGVLVVFPLVWMLISSLKNNMEFYVNQWGLPEVYRFSNYLIAWTKSNVSRYFLNSMIVVLGSVLLYGTMVSTNAYIFAKFRFRGKRILEALYFLGIMIPGVLKLTPLYFQLESVGLTDNLVVLMFIHAINGLPSHLIMLITFFKGIDNAFIEAAVIDGASEWQVFKNIAIPLVKPILFFTCIGNIMGTWNDYTIPLVFISDPKKYTVAIGLHFLELSESDRGILFAGLIISMIPVLILYGLFQKQIQEGVSAGDGVKG